jgi:SpoU rRNA methylase family enzyme
MGSLNQLSGINVINIYSETILEEIPQISTQFGVTLLSIANVLGAALSPLMTKVTTLRKFIIAG